MLEDPIPANGRPSGSWAAWEHWEAEKVRDNVVESREGRGGDSVRHRDGQEKQVETPVEGIVCPSLAGTSLCGA